MTAKRLEFIQITILTKVHTTMTQLTHKPDKQRQRTNVTYSTDQPSLNTPVEIILSWYDSQSDEEVKTEFTKSIAHFHPNTVIRTELNNEKKIQKFREFLTLPETQRSEIMRRAVSLIGHINLILQAKFANEKSVWIAKTAWKEWATQWDNPIISTLTNMKMYDWYFHSKPMSDLQDQK